MSAGKGDAPRPVNPQKYGENYDRIFRKTDADDDPKFAAAHMSHFGSVAKERPYGIIVRVADRWTPWRNIGSGGNSRFTNLEAAEREVEIMNRKRGFAKP